MAFIEQFLFLSFKLTAHHKHFLGSVALIQNLWIRVGPLHLDEARWVLFSAAVGPFPPRKAAHLSLNRARVEDSPGQVVETMRWT